MAKKTVAEIQERMERLLLLETEWLADALENESYSSANERQYLIQTSRIALAAVQSLGPLAWDPERALDIPDPKKSKEASAPGKVELPSGVVPTKVYHCHTGCPSYSQGHCLSYSQGHCLYEDKTAPCYDDGSLYTYVCPVWAKYLAEALDNG